MVFHLLFNPFLEFTTCPSEFWITTTVFASETTARGTSGKTKGPVYVNRLFGKTKTLVSICNVPCSQMSYMFSPPLKPTINPTYSDIQWTISFAKHLFFLCWRVSWLWVLPERFGVLRTFRALALRRSNLSLIRRRDISSIKTLWAKKYQISNDLW